MSTLHMASEYVTCGGHQPMPPGSQTDCHAFTSLSGTDACPCDVAASSALLARATSLLLRSSFGYSSRPVSKVQTPKSELQTKRSSPAARIRHTHPSSPSPRLPAAAPPLLSEFRLPPPRGECFRIRLVRRSSRGLLDPDPDPARPPVQGTLDPSPCPPLKSYHAMRTPSSCTSLRPFGVVTFTKGREICCSKLGSTALHKISLLPVRIL